MHRYGFAVCLGFVFLWTSGCATEAKKPGDTVAIKGTVNLDAKPMPDGEIRFSAPGEPVVTIPITNGTFAGKAPVGKNSVEVYRFKDGPPLSTDPKGSPTKVNTLPPTYSGTDSKLTAEVTKSGPNDFKFDITSN
jgi:hypothetical protein